MRAYPRTIGFALATLSGCLWFLACPPYDGSALAWLAAVPMLFAIERAPTLKSALFLGWWAGVIETAGGFYWLVDVMQRFAGFPWLAAAAVFFLFCATRAVIFLIFAAIVCAIRRWQRFPMALLAPLAMAIGEWVVPQLFPSGQWISQAWHPLVIQVAELTGPLGVTALLMLVNGALYDLCIKGSAWRGAVTAAFILAAALVFGAVRMRQVDSQVARAPRLDIGLVQPNFAYTVDGDFSREEALRQLTALQAESQRLERAGAQLTVWSEGSYPITLGRDFSADFPIESVAMIRRGLSSPLIIGANTFDPRLEDAYNTALLLDHFGQAIGRYDKVRLLAFGEYIPGIDHFPWLQNLLPPGTGRFAAGSSPGLMALPVTATETWRLAPVICYEDLLPGFLRGVGALHPDLLVNLTSDSWFGAQSEPWEHLALSVFATIELRVAMVRSVNSGISAMVDPNGRLLRHTYADDPYRQPRPSDGILVSAPKMPGGHTLFVAWGNWFPYLCAFATLILGLLAAKQKVRIK